jgi:hypothetical protein
MQIVIYTDYYAIFLFVTLSSYHTFFYLPVRAAWKELEALIWHACKREYKTEAYDPYIESNNLEQAATKFLDLAAIKLA